MDQYDSVLNDVIHKTDDGAITWKTVNPQQDDILLNAHQARRAFAANYQISQKVYNLLFVEKRNQIGNELLARLRRPVQYELLILDADRQIILSLFDGMVDHGELVKLGGLIADRNDRTKQFFEAFERRA